MADRRKRLSEQKFKIATFRINGRARPPLVSRLSPLVSVVDGQDRVQHHTSRMLRCRRTDARKILRPTMACDAVTGRQCRRTSILQGIRGHQIRQDSVRLSVGRGRWTAHRLLPGGDRGPGGIRLDRYRFPDGRGVLAHGPSAARAVGAGPGCRRLPATGPRLTSSAEDGLLRRYAHIPFLRRWCGKILQEIPFSLSRKPLRSELVSDGDPIWTTTPPLRLAFWNAPVQETWRL